MKNKNIKILADKIESDFLPFVRRPGRYIGGEINQIKKELAKCDLTIALCFPDVYEVAMSYTGLAILYEIINKEQSLAAERAFAPWADAEQILRKKQIPLFTLESKANLKSFDVIAFSLTNELCYTNVLNMLDLANLNVRSAHRKDSDPLVIAGGQMANCCEPLARFIDIFVLGEAEDTLPHLIDLIIQHKNTGDAKKDILLDAAKKFNWLYVPSLYEFEYENEKIKSLLPTEPDLPTRFENAVVEDFEDAPVPLRPIVPFTKAIHERVTVEIMRGCPGRCRFCQAGFCRRPVRYRTPEKITQIAKQSYHATGFDTVSLLSLSTADYPKLEQLISMLHEYFHDKHVGISLPSLRVDKQLKLMPELVTSVRKRGLTIAVEAAGEKLRQIINKPLKDKDLFDAVQTAYHAGWKKLKLYFMVGLPGENENDIKQIVNLSYQLAKLRKNVDGKTAQINVAVSWLVPKPHTPFATLPQKTRQYFENAKKIILDEKRNLHAKFLQFKFHNINRSLLESAIGRSDRKLCDVIEYAWKNGARFDLWDECFDYSLWQKAFQKFNLDIETAATKQFDPDEIFPWDHLGGPEKNYLLKHLNDSIKKLESAS
ncbi:MAG: TIGR03960 family B12-binding radical SAM protein [Sedimentisphaerales bacterium]|nr:TIGR03960 family B12-binding radical SAM protein [Sedimentisphaerales bacterium]